MKKLFLLLLLCPVFTYAQEAVIHFDIKNSADKEISLMKGNHADAEVLFGPYYTDLPLTNGKAIYTANLVRPVFLSIYYRGDTTKMGDYYSFFLSPGDNLNFSVDALNPKTTIAVTGKGSNNNQPAIQQLDLNNLDLNAYKKDSLPGNVLKAIKAKAEFNRQVLKKYSADHKPTKEFSDMYSLYVQYFPVWGYLRFKGNQKFSIRKAYYRNEATWEAIEDSIVRVTPLSNPVALQIPSHAYFLSTYLTRLKERIWSNPELAKVYNGPEQPTVDIMKLDPENLLREKIVDKHFTGKAAEFLYADIFKGSINETEDYLPEIFARFKMKYPESQYRPYIEPDIRKIEERRKRKLTSSMKLENSESYQTFDDVLKLVKGKTVLLDMWGTWCGPCRSELLQNSDSIKHYFNNKGLDYLYIANHDIGKDDKWKELISYYNLTGTHILASANLTKDIMTKVKGTGFPTYVIIKKDGTFELSEAGYPMKREVLVKQLEKVLNEN